MKLLPTVLVILALAGCTQPNNASRVLEEAGYSNVEMRGYDFFGCSEDDLYHDKFTATGPTGRQVSGVVCSGWFFKASTIRLN